VIKENYIVYKYFIKHFILLKLSSLNFRLNKVYRPIPFLIIWYKLDLVRSKYDFKSHNRYKNKYYVLNMLFCYTDDNYIHRKYEYVFELFCIYNWFVCTYIYYCTTIYLYCIMCICINTFLQYCFLWFRVFS